MSQVMEQVSQSTMGEAARNYDAQYVSVANKKDLDDEMDDIVVMDEEGSDTQHSTESEYPVTFRRTSVRQSRETRHIHNQDNFRHLNKCPPNLQQQQQQQQSLVQTTLVTLLDVERLWMAKHICARWKDPIVMIMYFADENEYSNAAESFGQEMKMECSHVNLLFFVDDSSPGKKKAPYPINLLRNLALEEVQTSHVLLTDGDFLPSRELSTEIAKALELRKGARRRLNITEEHRDALVVPSFQIEFQEESQQHQFLENPNEMAQHIPSTFERLQRCVNTTVCSVFQEREKPERHSSTRARRWLQKDWYEELSSSSEESIRNIKPLTCTASPQYVPYMVLPWCPNRQSAQRSEPISPLYDERFVGHGNSKIQYVEHIRHLMYDFMVIPKGFLVHAPHGPSTNRPCTSLQSGNNDLLESFKEEVHQKFGHRLNLRRCNEEQLAELERDRAGITLWMPPDEAEKEPLTSRCTPLVKPFEFFNTLSSEVVVLRLSGLKADRTIRSLSNQEKYRHVASCPANIPTNRTEVTLVTHLDFERHRLVKEIYSRWSGPLVVVLYFSKESDYIARGTEFRDFVERNCPGADLLYVINDLGEKTLYPINLLRNLAMEGARTSHVLLTDADFLPSEDLAEEITAALRVRKEARQDLRIPPASLDALVVPAFQVEPKDKPVLGRLIKQPGQDFVPRRFEGLQECINKTMCSVFLDNNGPMGHSSTRTQRWLEKDWYEEIPNSTARGTRRPLSSLGVEQDKPNPSALPRYMMSASWDTD
eukprot:scaffold2760_cov167-Amphora_coffeaeformis.AAC.10